MQENKQALEYIHNFINSLNKNFLVDITDENLGYLLRIFLNETHYDIRFPRSLIEDLEIAIEKYKNSNYFYSLESAIKFMVYIPLGKEGLLKNFDISDEIINEKRDWLKDYRVDVIFDAPITEVLFKGLTDIRNYFDLLLEKHSDLDLSEIKDHKQCIQWLIDYYDKNKNLNSKRVGFKNLQYLKAAAVAQIFCLEARKRNEKNPSIVRAVDKNIYYIVEQLRKDPFLGIKPPDFINDLKNMEIC